MISFREIADAIDAFDKDVADINEGRKKFWGAIRDQIPARDVKALKDAIKARRKRRANLEEVEAYDARVAEILEEIEIGTDLANISTRTGAPRERHPSGATITPASLGVPAHDPSTGELIEDEAPRAERLTGADETAPVSGDVRESDAALSRTCDRNASPNNSDPVTASADGLEIPAFLRRSAA